MAVIADIADAIVTELNSPGAPGFSQAFTAARAYLPRYDLAEMADLHVTVVPKGVEIDVSSRSLAQHDYSIDIAVQQRISGDDQEGLDGLMGLVEEVADFFRQRRLTQFPQAIWVKTANVPIYAPDHLDQLRQFTSVLTLTFRVLR
jgi:hypothetical protein